MKQRLYFLFTLLFCIIVLPWFSTAKLVNPYRILGVKKRSSTSDIKAAFKKLAKEWHPDKNKSPKAEQKFKEIQLAFENLKDDELRQFYNRNGFYKSDTRSRDLYGGYSPARLADPDIASSAILVSEETYPILVLDDVMNSKRIWIIKVYASRCGTCERISSDWEDFIDDFEGVMVAARLQYDTSSDLVRNLGIRTIPSIFTVVPSGKTARVEYYNRRESLRDFDAARMEQFVLSSLDEQSSPLVILDRYSTSQEFIGSSRAPRSTKIVFISTIWKTPPLHLRAFVLRFSASHPDVSFGFLYRMRQPLPHVDRVIDSSRDHKSEILVLREAEDATYIEPQFESLLKRDVRKFEEILHAQSFLYMPMLSHHNYFEHCFLPLALKLCFVAITDEPDNFWATMARKGMSSKFREFLGKRHVNFGWLSAKNEAAFVKSIQALALVRAQEMTLIAIKPSRHQLGLYKGILQQEDVEDWMACVMNGTIQLDDMKKSGGLPFLSVDSSFSMLDPFETIRSLFSRRRLIRVFRESIISWIYPLVTPILYFLLFVIATWVLLFAPVAL